MNVIKVKRWNISRAFRASRMGSVAFLVFVFCFWSGLFSVKAEVLPSYETSPSENCCFVGLSGSYLMDAQGAIDRINAIRYEACEEGVSDPRDSSRKLTLADYVPIKWSKDLETIARLRAAEASITIAHSRINGKSIYDISSNGVNSTGEVLAAALKDEQVLYGIEVWYREKENWVNQNLSNETGHYKAMINPSNTYVGLGFFKSNDTEWDGNWAGEFCGETGSLDDSTLADQEDIIQTLDVKTSLLQYGLSVENVYIGYESKAEPELTLTWGDNEISVTYLSGLDISYASSDSTVASVNAQGTVTGLKEGETEISLLLDGETVATETVKVTKEKVLCPYPNI